MNIDINIHGIKRVTLRQLSGFDAVTVHTSQEINSSEATLYLPHGTGQSVADAINAAVKAEVAA